MKKLLVFLITLLTSHAFSQNEVKEINIGLVMIDIAKVDNLNETVNAEFVLLLSWKDTSLVAPGQSAVRYLPIDSVNAPLIQIINIRPRNLWSQRG
jgi:hypothetical protein